MLRGNLVMACPAARCHLMGTVQINNKINSSMSIAEETSDFSQLFLVNNNTRKLHDRVNSVNPLCFPITLVFGDVKHFLDGDSSAVRKKALALSFPLVVWSPLCQVRHSCCYTAALSVKSVFFLNNIYFQNEHIMLLSLT